MFIDSERRGGVLPFEAEEQLGPAAPESRYHIADSQRNWVNIPMWLRENQGDPAISVSPVWHDRHHV